MRKFIVIGPCRIDIMMPADTIPGASLRWMPGSALQNCAMLLAQQAKPVWMIGEVARDAVGTLLCRTLETAGVNTECIDRVSTGEPTSAALFVESSAAPAPILYNSQPEGRFDASWPRIDPGDVVILGSPTILTPRYHQFLTDLLDHIADRNAITVYAPQLTPHEVPRITRATPVILELMERADITVLSPTDAMMLFATTDADKCYKEHVRFYCPTMVYCNEATGTLTVHHHDLKGAASVALPQQSLIWQSGELAALACALDHLDIRRAEPKEPLMFSSEQLNAIASLTADGADAAARSAIINH